MLNLRKSSFSMAILSVLLLILMILSILEFDSVNSSESISRITIRNLHYNPGSNQITDSRFTIPKILNRTYGLECNAFELEDALDKRKSPISMASTVEKANYRSMILSYRVSA